MTTQIYRPYVCEITDIQPDGADCIVTTAIAHGFVLGNTVTFQIPSNYGMTQLDHLKGNVIDLTETTITVDINITNFNAFTIPTPDEFQVFQTAQVIPIGSTNTGFSSVGNVVLNPLRIPGAFTPFRT